MAFHFKLWSKFMREQSNNLFTAEMQISELFVKKKLISHLWWKVRNSNIWGWSKKNANRRVKPSLFHTIYKYIRNSHEINFEKNGTLCISTAYPFCMNKFLELSHCLTYDERKYFESIWITWMHAIRCNTQAVLVVLLSTISQFLLSRISIQTVYIVPSPLLPPPPQSFFIPSQYILCVWAAVMSYLVPWNHLFTNVLLLHFQFTLSFGWVKKIAKNWSKALNVIQNIIIIIIIITNWFGVLLYVCI